MPPANPTTTPTSPITPTTPEKAKALLVEAGYDGTPIQLAYSDWIMASTGCWKSSRPGLRLLG
ncbi:MAG: hypothetical protein RMK65_11650 [Anaerolineae bacterium]|nr:hypothetical protein [Anaerolineae bacterium]